jgi:hypothetical protein
VSLVGLLAATLEAVGFLEGISGVPRGRGGFWDGCWSRVHESMDSLLMVDPYLPHTSSRPTPIPRPPTLRRASVLAANAHPSMSHVSADFIPVFGYCLRALRKVLYTEKGQPFIIAGSGTLGWCVHAASKSGDCC